MLHILSFTTIPATEATASSTSNLQPVVTAEPWFIQLWNAPGFSEFATGFLIATSTLLGVIITIRHQKRKELADKKKDVAENILDPFNDVLLGFEEIGSKKDMPLMARAVMTVYYSLTVEEKELRKQLKKAQTLAKLYTPNYIEGTVSTLSFWCLGLLNGTKIEDSRFQQIKELVNDLSRELINWTRSDKIKGKDKTFEDIAKEIEEKHPKKRKKITSF